MIFYDFDVEGIRVNFFYLRKKMSSKWVANQAKQGFKMSFDKDLQKMGKRENSTCQRNKLDRSVGNDKKQV